MSKTFSITTAFFTKPRVPLGIVVLLVLCAIMVTWYAAVQGSRAYTANLMEHHSLGDIVITPGISFRAETLRVDRVGAGPFVPREGYEFVIPTITLTNIGIAPLEIIPLLHFHVRDTEGNVYPITAIPSTGAQFSGTILPGDTLREEIGFEVPQNAGSLTLYFEPGLNDRTTIAIDLSRHRTWWPW